MGDKKITLNFDKPSYEWSVCQEKLFGVLVRAWRKSEDEWNWNVYAMIYPGHPLHQDVSTALNLPFHKGANYEKRIVTSPARGIRYDWEKVSDVLKIGNDYAHAYDEWATESDPAFGIPPRIQMDARELVAALTAEVPA